MGDDIREFSSHYSGENLYGFFPEEIRREVAGIIEKKPNKWLIRSLYYHLHIK